MKRTLAESMMAGPGGRDGVDNLSSAIVAARAVLLNIALRLCRNEAEANDLVQDTCERALGKVDAVVENPRAWLVVMMHRLFIDQCRVRKRRPRHVEYEDHMDVPVDAPVEDPFWAALTVDDIVRALPSLDEPLRRTYELKMFEKRSYTEIAAILGIEPNSVGTRLHRARKQLRELLKRRHD